jgi:thiol:disulfide interchange protein DsbD
MCPLPASGEAGIPLPQATSPPARLIEHDGRVVKMNRPAAAALGRLLIAAVTLVAGSQDALAQLGGGRVEVEWAFESTAAHPGSTVRAGLRATVERTFHVHSNKPLEDNLIPTVLTVTPPEGITVKGIIYPEPVMLRTQISPEPLSVFENEFVIGVVFDVAADVEPGSYPIRVELSYQACDDKVCMAPESKTEEPSLLVVPASETIEANASLFLDRVDFSAASTAVEPPATGPREGGTTGPTPAGEGCDVMAELEDFELRGATGGYLGVDKFIEFVDDAEQGIKQKNPLEGKGPLAILAIVIIGGVLLNLTPCVLPLIPINLAIIGAGAQAGSRRRGFALGGAYGLAMALVYGILGVIVVLGLGTFGQINSTIWFNLAIAALFVVLALAMFDVIVIDFTKYQTKLDVQKKAGTGTFLLAFGMGSVTALLAGACVAPVLISVLVYSGDQYARGSTLALGLPFCLGLGMALPWPFAGAGLSFLPKPGTWMVRVKQGMGVLILLFAAYYGYLAWEIYDNTRGVTAADRAAAGHVAEGWTGSICQGLAEARAENKPILIDMWATWCKNCIAMKKTTFKDERVLERLDGYVKVEYQAEDLGASPAKEMLKLFNGKGLPTYAILRPKGEGKGAGE